MIKTGLSFIYIFVPPVAALSTLLQRSTTVWEWDLWFWRYLFLPGLIHSWFAKFAKAFLENTLKIWLLCKDKYCNSSSYFTCMLEDCFYLSRVNMGHWNHQSTGDTWMILASTFSSIKWHVRQTLSVYSELLKSQSLSSAAVEYIWMCGFLQSRHLSSCDSPCLGWSERSLTATTVRGKRTTRKLCTCKHTHTHTQLSPSLGSPARLSRHLTSSRQEQYRWWMHDPATHCYNQ